MEVTHQNGRWLVGAEDGVISHSADGENWSTVSVSYTKAIEAIAHWNGTYYAGAVDNATVLKSTDLVNWTSERPADFPFNVREFLAMGDTLYAIGASPDIAMTTDGETWTPMSLPRAGRYEGLATDGNILVAVGAYFEEDDTDPDGDGDSYEGVVYSSGDGVTWTERLINVPIENSSLEDDFMFAEYVNGRFIAGGKQGLLASSTDGITWTVHDTPFESWMYGAVFFNGSYYFPGRQGVLHKTSDFIDWEDVQTEASQTLQDIFFADGRVLSGGRDGLIVLSNDGTSWPAVNTGTREYIHEIEFGNDTHVAADTNGGIWWSADSETWNLAFQDPVNDPLAGLVWDGTQFVGISSNGFLLTSMDGQNWAKSEEQVVTSRTENLRKIGDTWWIVGEDGLIATSTDLVNWDERTEGTDRFLDIASGNNAYVLTGVTDNNNEGVIHSSPDGVTWTQRDTTLEADNRIRLNTVAFANGIFVALGQSTTLLTSTDGNTWTSGGVQGQTPFNSQKLNIIDGMFVAPDLSGYINTSADGTSWTRTRARTSRAFYDVVVTDERTVAVGSNGMIMSSPVVVPEGYAAWVLARFTEEQQDDPGISGIGADPDVDGRPNGAEYYSNTPPLSADAGLPFEVMIVEDGGSEYAGFEITRKTDITDATLSIRISTDLANWSTLAQDDLVEVSTTPLDADTESVVFRTTQPIADGNPAFLQIGVTVEE